MYEKFSWTDVSKKRNKLTQIFEPLQPFLLWKMTETLSNVRFFDIGANVGVYSIFLAARANVAEVLTFEPMQDCVAEIRRNAKLNGLSDKIRVVSVALSDTTGTATFRRMAEYSGGNGISDTHLFKDLPYASEETVKTKSLDDTVSMLGEDIVLKIDVEGHEFCVLRGAEQLLANNRGILQIEIHESSPKLQETFDILTRLGWTKVLKVGWDYYFSNLKEHKAEAGRIALIEEALGFIVEQSLQRGQPARRELLNGLTLELSREKADGLKRFLSTFLRQWRKR